MPRVKCSRIILVLFLVILLNLATVITNDTSNIVSSSFEFIIVGGGTTGLAIANRLAVNHSVLVVERGPDLVNDEIVNNPYMFAAGTPSPCRFSMSSTPQVGFRGTRRSLPLFYGSCLGGSSSINGMMGARPTFASMNAIQALGNPGWGWNDFLPYMQKSESFTPPNPWQMEKGANYIAAVHGYDGPVGVSFARPLNAPVLQSIAKNTTQTVFDGEVTLSPDMGDGFSGGHVSSFYYQIHFNKTLHSDRRSSSAWASRKLCTDVWGRITLFNASREVIISAGALQSPAILQRSGIGNAMALRNLQIELVMDLPGVGANLQDHVGLYNASFPLAPSANTTTITSWPNILPGIVVTHPTTRNTLGLQDSNAMDILLRGISTEYTVSVGGVVNSESLARQAVVIAEAYQIDHPFIELFFTPGSVSLAVAAHTILPLSRGSIHINTTDPSADPIADMQYLTSEVDIRAAVAAARRISLIAVTPPFSDLITEDALHQSGVPLVNATEEELRKWVLDTYVSDIHFFGSNSMMPKELGGVVSPQLLVYADASILPLNMAPNALLYLQW
ncbi:glucose oxidase [Lentinula edodes]|uniref:Glucose oxidase n=1 Tax=Lentinula edodes TaxID=5353 RepID=A0A1Q3EB49_LENED|nr:glucose oxidase [Lentinula edodes]